MTAPEKSSPSLLEALFPIALLVSLLGASVAVYGEDSSYGPNQIALLLRKIQILSTGSFVPLQI